MSDLEFRCDVRERLAPLEPFWQHTVGSCHAPLALRADWQSQLRRCRQELGFRHVRFHGLLCDDLGTLVRRQGKLLYSFFNADRIIDFLLSIGVRPFVELSFMPEALASGHVTVFKYRGNITPPRKYAAWAELVRRLVGHWIDRYGIDEVRTWYFEVWNEPNLKAFWTGTQSDYFRLYRHAAEAIKGLDPGLRVGGPATARNAWIEEFLDFCARHGVAVDFVSTHHYPNDAAAGETGDTTAQLAASRRSVLREQAQDACRRAAGLPLYYTEWNTSSNPRDPLHDEPYAAAFVTKTLLEANGLVAGYSFWTFSDIFEESYFPSAPFHGGFGLLTLHGIPKPAYRAFELLGRLGDELLLVDGRHPTVDAWIARGSSGSVMMLLVNHALPRHPIAAEQVAVRLLNVSEPQAARLERIDAEHANPKRRWTEMGSPEYLDESQVAQLERASEMVPESCRWEYDGESVRVVVNLAPHSVAAVTLDFPRGTRPGEAPWRSRSS